MRVQLIIKGSVQEAQRYASERGMTLECVRPSRNYNSIIAETNGEVLNLNQWFCEPIDYNSAKEFPVGSLLHWSPINITGK